MVDFRTKDGKKLDRVALKKSGRFPVGLVCAISDVAVGTPSRSIGTKAAPRPALRPTVRSGATISADTAQKLGTAIQHCESAASVCKALIDPLEAVPTGSAEVARSWSHWAIKLTG